MSARRLLSSIPKLRTRQAAFLRRRELHSFASNGILQNPTGPRSLRQRRWPAGTYSIHNVPTTRPISFASFTRVLPKLATKLLRIPALAGVTAVGGLAYIQHQANRERILHTSQYLR